MKKPVIVAFLFGACAGATVRPASSALASFVRPLDTVETRSTANGSAKIRLLAQGQNAFLGRLELDPGGVVPENVDPTEEYIHVLEGGGKLWIDDVEHAVGPGTTVFMPPGVKARYENGPAKMVAIQVFATPEPAKKYDAWR